MSIQYLFNVSVFLFPILVQRTTVVTKACAMLVLLTKPKDCIKEYQSFPLPQLKNKIGPRHLYRFY